MNLAKVWRRDIRRVVSRKSQRLCSGRVEHLLSTQDAVAYWEKRHQATEGLRAGGDIGLSQPENEAFYMVRAGQLLAILPQATGDGADPIILDAGCGTGYFSGVMHAAGYQVTGVDASSSAIQIARETRPGPHYAVGTLAEPIAMTLFDCAVSIDVLFHITDDVEWAQSLRNIATHLSYSGRLIFTDRNNDSREQLGDYIMHRPQSDYDKLLAPLGFSHQAFEPFRFPNNPIGFHTYERVN